VNATADMENSAAAESLAVDAKARPSATTLGQAVAAQNGTKRHGATMLTPGQTKLVSALIISPTIKAACRRAKVSERAYRKWKSRPEFLEALATAQRGAWSDSVGLLKGLAPLAVRRLRRLLLSSRPDVQLRAALGLIDRGVKAIEADDIMRRLAALEEQIGHAGEPALSRNGANKRDTQ
jgi:hypothetical protein